MNAISLVATLLFAGCSNLQAAALGPSLLSTVWVTAAGDPAFRRIAVDPAAGPTVSTILELP